MKKTVQILRNEEGSVILVAMIIMVLLLVMGISATNMSSIEMQILRNTIMQKQEFYFTEGSMVEVATDVNLASPERVSAPTSVRTSEVREYAITNIDMPIILTKTAAGDTKQIPTPISASDKAIIDNYGDMAWPTNYNDSGNEYAYRVYFKGQGPMPKGYGAGFGSYIFDITVRKQSAAAASVSTTTINEGFRKIGPKG